MYIQIHVDSKTTAVARANVSVCTSTHVFFEHPLSLSLQVKQNNKDLSYLYTTIQSATAKQPLQRANKLLGRRCMEAAPRPLVLPRLGQRQVAGSWTSPWPGLSRWPSRRRWVGIPPACARSPGGIAVASCLHRGLRVTVARGAAPVSKSQSSRRRQVSSLPGWRFVLLFFLIR